MSDIFISYAKADHAEALKLSAFLEAEGWSVWYDKDLGAADLFRDEIMKQLAAARAVITIWTPNSIKSDWVRAEAGAAKRDGKLIPVNSMNTFAPISRRTSCRHQLCSTTLHPWCPCATYRRPWSDTVDSASTCGLTVTIPGTALPSGGRSQST